jgi:hypothetical protein
MRTIISIIALSTVFSFPAAAVDGTDLPGSDYRSFPAPDARTCRNSCGGEERCQAYTWVKPGYQGPNGICYLKHSEPEIVSNPCCDSGPRRFIEARNLGYEDKINRAGSDFTNFETLGGSRDWEQCRQACLDNGICRSWTYVRPGIQGPKGRCWLKNAVAAPSTDVNTVSGVKYRPASVRID